MLKRTLTGIVLAAVVVGIIVLGSIVKGASIAIDLLILLFSILAACELFTSFKRAKVYPFFIPVLIMMVAAYPAYRFFGLLGLFITLLASAAVAITMFTFSDTLEPKNSESYNPFDEHERKKNKKTINDLTATVFIMIYPFMFLASTFELTRNYSTLFVTIMAAFLPIAADTFAYFVGSTIGGKKLCPKISPKKTIAGAVGALVGGLICAAVLFLAFEYYGLIDAYGYRHFSDKIGVGVTLYLLLGLLSTVVGLIGDLAESKIKRQLGIKDFGNIFPGHGGALDRVDSIMFTLVLLYAALPLIYA
ncbi:MAG TPA: phosphatidate cytidylyltransferase [Clostridia bacterium]|nr:phosphatidate cytidylyltransferase [Clostridia bacterium]HRU84444.1 phosphatidate cytidylyltransferase [Eubacteriales bacterium]